MSGSHDTRRNTNNNNTTVISPADNKKKVTVKDKGQNSYYDEQIAKDTYSTQPNKRQSLNSDKDPTLNIHHGNPKFDHLQDTFVNNLKDISASQNSDKINPDGHEDKKSRADDQQDSTSNHNQTTNKSQHEKADLPESDHEFENTAGDFWHELFTV